MKKEREEQAVKEQASAGVLANKAWAWDNGGVAQEKAGNLCNSKYLEEFVEFARDKQDEGVLIVMDVDNLKEVNTNFGYMVGDELLEALVNILCEHVGEGNLVCRLGGDSFAVFVNSIWSDSRLGDWSETIIALIEDEVMRILDPDNELLVSVSIGIARKPQEGVNYESLYSSAMKALNHIKENGKRGYFLAHAFE
jgi:diguanylate cyclase (GGDEF)-like protein